MQRPNATLTALDELHQQILTCTRCPLHQNRTHAVPGEGNPRAKSCSSGKHRASKKTRKGVPLSDQRDDF